MDGIICDEVDRITQCGDLAGRELTCSATQALYSTCSDGWVLVSVIFRMNSGAAHDLKILNRAI